MFSYNSLLKRLFLVLGFYMNTDFIFVIDQEENLTIIPFNEVGQIKIFVTEYKPFQLIWFQNNYDYVLYETKDEDEILQAKDYVYEKILQAEI